MEELKEKGVFMNPYIIQMDKFAESLKHLSRKFLSLEGYKSELTQSEKEELFQKVTMKVCEGCDKRNECLGEKKRQTYQMIAAILGTVEEYGAELNIELKRKLQKQCLHAPRFLRETLENYGNAKQMLIWNNKVVKNREGYAMQLNHFAETVQHTTREIDAGIIEDVRLEKKIKAQLKRKGIKLISSVFYLTPDGKYEIHLTVKANKGQCITTKEFAAWVGNCVGRVMVPKQGERPILGEEYCTVACMEDAKYFTMQGVAKIGKNCETISGDTFLMTNLPGGKKGVALSDGMGTGENAFRESAMVVEMLEELLEAGFPVKTAIQMMNTALVTGREELYFSTVDVCMFDLYSGSCEIVKAGAAATFIKRKDKIEKIASMSLPIGVMQDIEIEVFEKQLEAGDFVIMITDGVMEALPAVDQEGMIKKFIRETKIQNPTEFAHYLMGKVLEESGEVPADDMTIIVVGIWKN